MTPLSELIARVEGAGEPPSWSFRNEIAREIALAIGWTVEPDVDDSDIEWWTNANGYSEGNAVPDFLGSLDAAISLAGGDTIAVLLEALAAASRYFVQFRDKGGNIVEALPRFVTVAALRARTGR